MLCFEGIFNKYVLLRLVLEAIESINIDVKRVSRLGAT